MYTNAGKGLKVSPFVSRCGSLAASVMIVVAAAEERMIIKIQLHPLLLDTCEQSLSQPQPQPLLKRLKPQPPPLLLLQRKRRIIIQIQLHPQLLSFLLSAVQPQWLAVNSLIFLSPKGF